MARACAHVCHTNDTHAFPQTNSSLCQKTRLIALSARHLLLTEEITYPPSGSPPPHLKVPDCVDLFWSFLQCSVFDAAKIQRGTRGRDGRAFFDDKGTSRRTVFEIRV